jgi:hypothetical protein
MKAQEESRRPKVVALVHRIRTGCRQYIFETADDLAKWASRHPYRNEQLRVMPLKGEQVLGDRWLPAAEAAAFVRGALGASQTQSHQGIASNSADHTTR